MLRKSILAIIFAMLLVGMMFNIPRLKADFVGTIKIGVIGPIGLPHWSPAGMLEASEMARDEINAAGGVALPGGNYSITIVTGNSGGASPIPDTVTALSETDRLILIEGCEYLVGGFRTECADVILRRAAFLEVPFIINGASTDQLISETVGNNTLYSQFKYTFRINPINSTMLFKTIAGAIKGYALANKTEVPPSVFSGSSFMVDLFAEHQWGTWDGTIGSGSPPPGQVRVGIVTEGLTWTEPSATSVGIHNALTLPPGAYVYYPQGYPYVLGNWANVTYGRPLSPFSDGQGHLSPVQTDFSAELAAIKAAGCRLVIHIFSGAQGPAFSAQFAQAGVNASLVGINVMGQLKTHWTTLGGSYDITTQPSAAEYEAFLDFSGTRTPIVGGEGGKTTQFWDNFVARTGTWPIYTAWGAYDGIYALKEVFEAVGSTDKDLVREYLEGPGYQRTGLNGVFKYGSNSSAGARHDVFCNEYGPTWFQGYTRAMIVQWLDARKEVVCPRLKSYTRTWAISPTMYWLVWDSNYDKYVGIDDIVSTAEHFGGAPTQIAWSLWDHVYDNTFDDYVGIDDIVATAEHFGATP